MFEKLKKLKGRSFAEIADRCRQNANVLAERFGTSPQTRVPSDEEFFRMFDLHGELSAESLRSHFRTPEISGFYNSFENPGETLRVLQNRFPEEIGAIVKRADRICEGYFDLLGYENLFFESVIPNWHFEPISKKSSPMTHWSQIDETNAEQTGDKKIVWELNRHQYFSVLGRAYWITKDEKYAETFVRHVEDWIENNPPKIGLNWLSGLEIAFRSISWIWAFHFFRDSPALTAAVFSQMVKGLYLNGRHIETYLSTYSSPNTHLTGEALGLYFLGTVLPELRDAGRWKQLGYSALLNALEFQVRPDGVYCEQTSQYHRYTTDFYANLMILRQIEGLEIDEKHRDKLKNMLDFLMFIAQPNGETGLFGDDDGGRLHFLDERAFADFRATMAVGAVLFDDASLKFAAREASAEVLWLFGLTGLRRFDEIQAIEPNATSKAFDASGFFTVRDSWNDGANFLLIDCGEHGFLKGGHAHADALGFVLSVEGFPVFVDPGTCNYTSDPVARELYRSTAAHNCITVNNESSSIPDGPFSWKTSASARLLEWRQDVNAVIFRGIHDGFARFGVCYERGINFDKTGIIIIDDNIRCERSNSYEVNFILSPDIRAEITADLQVLLSSKAGNRVLLTIDTNLVSDKTGLWNIEPFNVSPRYGSLVESTKLVFKVKTDDGVRIINTITLANSA